MPHPGVEELLIKHRAFWEREAIGGLLMRLRRAGASDIEFQDMHLAPDMLDPKAYAAEAGNRPGLGQFIQGDLFRVECAYSRVPWMEAIMGCPIYAANVHAGGMWAEPVQKSWEELGTLRFREDNPWLAKLRDYTQELVAAADGAYLVCHTLMRGPSDMLRAVLGNERMNLAFYDHPREVHRLLEIAAEAFIATAKAQLELIPPFRGGFACMYSLWAPGQVVRTQDDSSSQFSARTYREFILPYQKRIIESFPYTVVDLHSGGSLHQHVNLLEVDALSAISVTIDPYESAPSIPQLIPTFQRIQEAKALLLHGTLSREELSLILEKLSPAGLSLDLRIKEE